MVGNQKEFILYNSDSGEALADFRRVITMFERIILTSGRGVNQEGGEQV